MDGPPPPEEDFTQIPIADRLVHKNWKARVSAYDSLIKSFQNSASDNDPVFKPYLNNPDLLKKAVSDSNAVAQEKGVECVVNLVKFAGEYAARTREVVAPALVEKCLGSTRAGTKNQAIELLLQYVEVENSGAGVVADIVPGLAAKQPKVVAGCVTAMKEIVSNFGTQAVPPPSVLKPLPKIFSHNDKTVRAEGTQLTHALYQFLGPSIESFLSDLKPVQVKELKEAWEVMEKDGKGKGTMKPQRLTRAAAREASEKAEAADAGDEAGDSAAGDVQEEPTFDPRSMAEEVDVISKLPANLYKNLASSKWKERKEALDDLSTLLKSSLRIKDGPEIGELAKSLATRINGDANVMCVIVAANCLEALADGLMTAFSRHREAVVPPILERLKERKANVTDAIGLTLDAVFKTSNLSDIIGDVTPALSSKNPQVKEGTLKFLVRCLSTSPVPIQPGQVKPLSEQLATLLEDSFEGARNEAATALGTLMRMVGERPLNAIMDGLPDVRKSKVKEAYEKATVKAKAGASGPPKSSGPPPTKASQKKKPAPKKVLSKEESPDPAPEKTLDTFDESPKAAKKPPARFMQKKAPDAASDSAPGPSSGPAVAVKKLPPTVAGPSKSKPTPPAAPSALDTVKYKHTPEDADALAVDLIPSNISADLGNANWKTRLAAIEEMTAWLEGVVEQVDSEVVVRFIAKKGWNEKNFQVSAKIYGILIMLSERCKSFGRSSVALSVPHLSEKLGDAKLKKLAGDALTAFACKTSLQFVLNQAYDPLSKQKAPKAIADATAWIEVALTEFGIAGLSMRSLIEFLKTGLKNSNAAVRTSTTKALVTVKLFAGPAIKDLLEDLNPQLLSTIFSEFDKVEGTQAPQPTREQEDVKNMAPATGSSKGAVADPIDDLFPRVDLDSLMKGTTILADCKSDAWKTKKEGLETLQAILDQGANKRLKSNMGEIGSILKARVVDSNKAVQVLALDIVSRIATGMGKPFEKHLRLLLVPVATVLSDQKANIRTLALNALTAMATACEGVDAMAGGLGTALETQNPVQRASILNWAVGWLKDNRSPGVDLGSWTTTILSCLDDRNSDVRKGAQAILPILIGSVGFDEVMRQTNSLKPASRSTVVPLVQAARANAPAQSAPPPKPTTTSAPIKTPAKPTPKITPPPSDPDTPPPRQSPGLSGPGVTGVRKPLPGSSTIPRPHSRLDGEGGNSNLPSKIGGLRRPGATSLALKSPSTPTSTTFGTSSVLTSANFEVKKARLAKDAGRWINEGGTTRKDLAELLQHQMEPHASKELVSLLFSHDHNAVNDHVAGMAKIVDLYSSVLAGEDTFGSPTDLQNVCVANSDLVLKYASIKAHEPQSNLIAKTLELADAVVSLLQSVNFQLTDAEAQCFIPTMVHKLGDPREPVRNKVQTIIQSTVKVYAYSRLFQLLLENGLQSKVAKTRQGTLDELDNLLRKFGIAACEPTRALPKIASMIGDKDAAVRKSALSVMSEAFVLVGEKIWSLVGPLSPKDKTQLEERLRRVPGPSLNSPDKEKVASPRTPTGPLRPESQASIRSLGIPRPTTPSTTSRLARPASPSRTIRSASPALSDIGRSASPIRASRITGPSHLATPGSSSLPPAAARPRSALPSRLGVPKPRSNSVRTEQPRFDEPVEGGHGISGRNRAISYTGPEPQSHHSRQSESPDDVTITISSILSNDPARSVDALKKIQKVLDVGPEEGPSSPAYRDLAEHTEGLIETIILQMAHVFERPEKVLQKENFRLAKHLIQTLNSFCDHTFLAESLTVDILTSLLEELTLRLLETDNSNDNQLKDLSRFINMIILRLFATARRMSVFRALFNLLLQIVKPFPANGTTVDSKEFKVAELVLKCIWKLARNIPQDLEKQALDPVELFPSMEHFLQSVPPNEWRARATNKVPCGDMPLRTMKVIIQHVVAHYGDDVYELLAASFDDPSATIVYPYVYRILNSATRAAAEEVNTEPKPNGTRRAPANSRDSPVVTRPQSPQSSVTSGDQHRSSLGRPRTASVSSANDDGYAPTAEEPDPDAQLVTIINHISSETTGAMHKEGITELHQFLKAYPHKKPRVEKLLESTGTAFRKYITRALASRAAEDSDRDAAVAHTLSKLESNKRDSTSPVPTSPVPTSPVRSDTPLSPRRTSVTSSVVPDDKLSRLHDIFQYRTSTASNGSSGQRGPL